MTLLNYRKSVAVLLPDTLFIVTVPVIHFFVCCAEHKFDMIILFSDNSMPVFCISIFYPDFQSASIKKTSRMGRILSMAESMRFELTVAFTTPPFQDGALNRSANSPRLPLLFYLFSKKCQQ